MTQFRILGPVEALENGERLPLGGPKPRTLLAVLLVAAGRTVPVEQLITELWNEAPPASATTVLQVYVSGLRKVLGDRLRRAPGGYLIDVGPGELDATEFERLVGEARAQLDDEPAAAAAGLAAALALWQGDPLSGAVDSPAVQAARVGLTEQRMTAVEDRFAAELALGRHDRIVSELAEQVAAYPLRERLTSQLMLAYHRCGRMGDAEQVYAAYAARCRDELDAEPSEQLTALAAAIRRHDPTLDPPSAGSLPVPASRFIGRRHELDRIEELLGQTRLLTLAGPGGAGKTRLALQLVRDLGTVNHPDGVHFVELAGAPDDAATAGRLAAALGVRELPGETMTESLVARLRYARVLVVLDNCEHVVDAVAALAAELLRGCSGLRLLATSREPLAVPGEVVVPVGGLGLPAERASYAEATRSEALRLLAERGTAARAGFQITPEVYRSALAICRRLDGLPLAIELAASRLRALSPAEIESRLDNRLDLAAESRGTAARHRTLRATIEWSHDLLDKEERTLFARLAVFAGGFTLAAAEQVGADPDGARPTDPAEILDLVTRLVSRSLVVPGPVGDDGTRFRMLETIGEYAAEQLTASGERDAVADRHAAWCQQLVESAPQFGGDDHTVWLDRLTAELDNLRAAMEWALATESAAERALAIATRMWWVWWTTGRMTEGGHWLRRALDAADPGARPLRGEALRAAAALARNGGDLDTARRLGEEALAVQRSLGDQRGLAMAWNNLCMTATGQRDFTAALEYAENSRLAAEQVGADRGLAIAANNSAIVLRCMDRLPEADDGFAEALRLFRIVGDRRGEAAAIFNQGVVAARRDRSDEARDLLLRSLRMYAELELTEGEVDAVEALAGLEVAAGRGAVALRMLEAADIERRRLGAPLFVPDEVAAREAALTAARATVGPAAVQAVPFEALVAELLGLR